MQFTYRSAGGNASLDLVARNPGTKEPVEAGKNGALLVIGPEGPGFAALPRNDQRLRMTFPVKLLCQLRGARAATLTPHAGGRCPGDLPQSVRSIMLAPVLAQLRKNAISRRKRRHLQARLDAASWRSQVHQVVRANRRDFLRHRIARHFSSLPRQGPVSVGVRRFSGAILGASCRKSLAANFRFQGC